MTMRIGIWISKLGRNSILKTFGDKMLQPFSLLMNFVPWIIEDVVKKTFKESVMANDFQRT